MTDVQKHIQDLTRKINHHNIQYYVYDNPIILKCNHVYCAKCIFSWNKQKSSNNCPYCKAKIDPTIISPIY